MVKFGVNYASFIHPPWTKYYIDYELLKQALKRDSAYIKGTTLTGTLTHAHLTSPLTTTTHKSSLNPNSNSNPNEDSNSNNNNNNDDDSTGDKNSQLCTPLLPADEFQPSPSHLESGPASALAPLLLSPSSSSSSSNLTFLPLLSSELQKATSHHSCLLSSLSSRASSVPPSTAPSKAVKAALEGMYSEFLQLSSFRSLNTTAVYKILKKQGNKYPELYPEGLKAEAGEACEGAWEDGEEEGKRLVVKLYSDMFADGNERVGEMQLRVPKRASSPSSLLHLGLHLGIFITTTLWLLWDLL
eukprot:CAMPEP_0197558242 /NCGR_PEP_ID=MMETSP1320-20131121/18792_1 /TAXON_ID=91990 /ORGANISM="Bolidomonas sp., Strain RCC2347" /LENGTH=299 /DNA_ID=CAMNT_0043119537 /DNA_START=526 /DNA_END=1422 /DNA_ORIENTATION=+